MYFPQSQIKTNLFTNGDEYILSTTKQIYKGYYYEISKGKKFSGKTPQDKPNIELLPIPESFAGGDSTLEPQENRTYIEVNFSNVEDTIPEGYKQPTDITRLIPYYNPVLPTEQDKQLGIFPRYFCKKTNELIYIEINKETFDKLSQKNQTIAWDLYEPQQITWTLKGNKEQVFKSNKSQVVLIEQRSKWYGLSTYVKNDYLKYYLES